MNGYSIDNFKSYEKSGWIKIPKQQRDSESWNLEAGENISLVTTDELVEVLKYELGINYNKDPEFCDKLALNWAKIFLEVYAETSIPLVMIDGILLCSPNIYKKVQPKVKKYLTNGLM